jgi:hypothetical protein
MDVLPNSIISGSTVRYGEAVKSVALYSKGLGFEYPPEKNYSTWYFPHGFPLSLPLNMLLHFYGFPIQR